MAFPPLGILVPILVFGGIAAIFLLVFWIMQRARAKHCEAIEAWAGHHGLAYERGVQPSWFGDQTSAETAKAYDGLGPVRTGFGSKPWTENVVRGTYRGYDVLWCEYRFIVSTGKSSHTVTYGLAVAHLPSPWPELTIVPEGLEHKIGQLFGGDDIDFESDEFSDRFWVRSEDRKFAYDLLHPRAMEHLLATSWDRWHVRDQHVCLWKKAAPYASEVKTALDELAGFLDLVPSFRRPAVRRVAVAMPPSSRARP